MAVRLVRYLAQCGVASRRKAADLVSDHLVAVNGEVTTDLSLGIEPGDRVTFKGHEVRPAEKPAILILNKPVGVVCSVSDPHNPSTVMQFVPRGLRNTVKPVGRLDKQSTGLLILTNDGDLAYRLTHPSREIEKTYEAVVAGRVPDDSLGKLRVGVLLEDGMTAPAKVSRLRYDSRTNRTTLELRIHEGRNRQVRRMCEAVGNRVQMLKRTHVGPISLMGLPEGEIRAATVQEERRLRAAVGLTVKKPRGDSGQ